MKKITLITIIFLGLFTSCKKAKMEVVNLETVKEITISKDLKWSERMALTLMKAHPNAYQIDDKDKPKWDYVHGLVLTSFQKLHQKTNKDKYYNYVKAYADTLINADGTIETYKFSNYNIDMIEAGNLLFNLYDTTKDEKYLKAMQLLRKQLSEHPRTTEGGFWHKKRYPSQMWLDGLFMGEPFYANYTVRFENGKQLDDVAKQFEIIQTSLRFKNWFIVSWLG